MRIWKPLRNATNLITLLGCILVLGIIFSGANVMAVMIVLGILNFYMGAYSYIEKRTPLRTDYSKVKNQISYCRNLGKSMMAAGLFISIMSILYMIQLIPEQIYWNIFLTGLLVITGIGFAVHKKGLKKTNM